MSNLSLLNHALLQSILKKRSPALVSKNLADLSADQIERICNIVMDEICQNGLQENDEPTEYGLKLEALIDQLRKQDIKKVQI